MSKQVSPNGRLALSLALITLLAPTATDMYLASMPDIARHLDVSYGKIQLTLTVFLLAQGLGQMFFGPVVDRFGRRKPLLFGIVVFIVSSIWAATSASFLSLLLSRFIQGFSGALLLVVGFSSVRDVAKGENAARLFSILLTIEGLAPVFAPIVGGYVDAIYGWRMVLLVSAFMGIATLINSFFALPETLPERERIVLKPSVIVRTYRQILCDRQFLLPTLALSGVFFFLFAYIGGGAYLYQDIFGLTPDSFGIVFGCSGAAVMLGAFFSGRMAKRHRVAYIGIQGVIIIIIGTLISLVSSLTVGFYGIVAGFIIALFGLGMSEPALVSMSMSSQKIALGFTAALMGALHLMLSSLSTPISGYLLPISKEYWFIFLLVSACGTLWLAIAACRAVHGRALKRMAHIRSLKAG